MARRRAIALITSIAIGASALIASSPAHAFVDKDCGDFPSQKAAQIFFLKHGGPQSDPHGLDGEGDGIACESNPAPYYYGTTLPGGGAGPKPGPQVVRSHVRLQLHPRRAIAGERFRMNLSVRPKISRSVVVQRRIDGRWKAFARGVTGDNGQTKGAFRVPAKYATYRAVVRPVTANGKKFKAATSTAQSVRVQRQQVFLTLDEREVEQGDQVRAEVRATPVRVGRSVALQLREGGAWQTVRTSNLNRRGRAAFTVTPQLGEQRYRAVALRHRGAAAKESATKTVTARDVTPPPAPVDLEALPGDGAVHLTWSGALGSDFDHHEVWMRGTADQTWSLVATTEASEYEVSPLQNDVTYWFTVTSVDNSGNVSEPADEVSAVPTAPVPSVRIRG